MEFAWKYPFSESARGIAKEVSEVRQLELEKARERVLKALHGIESKEKSAKEEVIVFALSKLLVAAANDYRLSSRFSAFEAKMSAKMLAEAGVEETFLLGKEFFNGLERKGEEFSVSVLEYVKSGSDLQEKPVIDGRVVLDRESFVALLRQAIEGKISSLQVEKKKLPKEVVAEAEKLKVDAEKFLRERERVFSVKGGYVNSECIQKLIAGVEEGKRYYASVTIALACSKDKMAKEEAAEVLKAFARNSRSSTHAFTEREALASLEWVYKHPGIHFSCKTAADQGLMGYEECMECLYGKRKK